MALSNNLHSDSALTCRYHPSAELIEDCSAGDVICSECGTIVGDRVIDVGCEWRNFGDASYATGNRVGEAQNPLLYEDITTGIDFSSALSPNESRGSKRNRIDIRLKNRALKEAFKIISRTAEKLHASQSIISSAHNIFKQMREMTKTALRLYESMAAGCLYVAFRREKCPMTFKEISAASGVTVRRLSRSYILIKGTFKSKTSTDSDLKLAVVKSADYIPRYCGNLNIPKKIENIALKIEKQSRCILSIQDRNPATIATAAVFYACQVSNMYRITEKAVANISGIAEFTIKEISRCMNKHLNLLPK